VQKPLDSRKTLFITPVIYSLNITQIWIMLLLLKINLKVQKLLCSYGSSSNDITTLNIQ